MTKKARCLMGAAPLAALALNGGVCRAEVKTYPLFSDDMVLQRDKPVPVFGTARPGERVSVSIAGQKHATTADVTGNWRIVLRRMKVARDLVLSIKGDNEVVFKNLAVGDVYVCSGQSNMALQLISARNGEAEVAAAANPDIRFFSVPHTLAISPKNSFTVNEKWQVSAPGTARVFSAVGYFFGRELQHELKIPIGLISASWGGTIAQSWMSPAGLAKRDDLREWSRQTQLKWAATTDESVAADLKKWEADNSAFPAKPTDMRHDPNQPGLLWNGMIAPLVPLPIKGVIWYQGESNAGDAKQYQTLFPDLIRDWRAQWGAKQDGSEFGFYFVQLANFTPRVAEPVQSGWAELREAQAMALSLPRTGMASAIDIGDAGDIHPTNKQDVGKRLALAALATEYGRKIVFSGPEFQSLELSPEARAATITFRSADGLKTTDGQPPKGFAILGDDGKWHAASAKIEGKKILLSSEARPVAVRYAWANNPDVNLVNAAGLPAAPFRTDSDN